MLLVVAHAVGETPHTFYIPEYKCNMLNSNSALIHRQRYGPDTYLDTRLKRPGIELLNGQPECPIMEEPEF